MALATDEHYIYSGSADRTVRVWDKKSFKEIAVLEGHSQPVTSIATDEHYIYSGSYDKTNESGIKNRLKK